MKKRKDVGRRHFVRARLMLLGFPGGASAKRKVKGPQKNDSRNCAVPGEGQVLRVAGTVPHLRPRNEHREDSDVTAHLTWLRVAGD